MSRSERSMPFPLLLALVVLLAQQPGKRAVPAPKRAAVLQELFHHR